MRIGALVPNSGPWPLELGIPALARTAEAAGYESLWVSDHIVLPERIESRYPFAVDGRATWPTDTPYVDALIALALIAGATERAVIGTAVLVLPLRHPVILAKQAASIDVASGGRLKLGVGAGWLREEFEALGVPFEGRGGRLVEWMQIARDCWTGRPPARSTERYTLPAGMRSLPRPAHEIPFLIGGHSPPALRRAGRIADGWLAQQSLSKLGPAALAAGVSAMRAAAEEAGRDPGELQVVLRLVDSAGRGAEIAKAVPALAEAGVDELVVNIDWEGGDPAAELARMRVAASD
ncbi:MAG: TIGR03619 family F420-dependent LLM class oxidoreductase [Gaiellaceae bacterium MAG52_C11]|nr:TIGR03619 family F420-dependent LLM class oxidoreductase [Candidatus Gaiellasilicea maunaloa]